jgi:plastocyanin
MQTPMKARTRELTGCFTIALGVALVGNCGGDDTSTTGAGSGGSTSASSSGTAGTGGAGGSTTGTGGSGGSGGAATMLNGCDSSTATDKTASTNTTVTFDDTLVYTPPCIRIKAGSSVTFTGDFMLHPLQGGTVNGATRTPDPASPIKLTSGADGGMSAMFAFPTAGNFGYYCTIHGGIGMKGAVFVVP